jgi:hypothetical protein
VTADLKAKHEPIVKGLQEAYEAASSKLAELIRKMTQWLEEVKTKPLTSYTISDTKLTLVRASIKFAPDVVDANKVDGNILNVCDDVEIAQTHLGLECVGDAIRVTKIVRALQQDPGVVVARDISVAGIPDQPATWSIQQFSGWVATTSISDLAPLLARHRFAGDVLVGDWEFGQICTVLKLTPLQRAAFRKELAALRSRVQATWNLGSKKSAIAS